MPGGAYMGLAAILEGREVADWFAAHGFTAFVLRYRLGKKYLLPVPLIDARRAVQLVRARANDYHITPDRIGVIGFSAGGNLAGQSETQFVPREAGCGGPDRARFQPAGFCRAGLSVDWRHLHQHGTSDLLQADGSAQTDRCDELRKAYSPDFFVTKETPPTFIYHTTNDETVPVEQALSLYRRS